MKTQTIVIVTFLLFPDQLMQKIEGDQSLYCQFRQLCIKNYCEAKSW